MKKLFLLILFSLFSFSIIQAQYNFDTLAVRQVSENITHYWVKEYSVPWNLNVLKIDLDNPNYFIETAKANDKLAGYETTSSMAGRNSYEDHYVIGAVNGDFYAGGGIPTNAQILQGELLREPINREIIGFDVFNNPMIDIVSYSGEVIGNETNPLSGVNRTRNSNELILYNDFFGTTTGTNAFGTEVVVSPLTSWIVNDTVYVVVDEKNESSGDSNIPEGKAVLSGHGTSATYLNNLSVGDTLKLVLELRPGLDKLKEMVGGSAKFVEDGINKGDWPERHPRTAAGFSADSSTLYLVVVDGRQSSLSAGMTLTELGDFMIGMGVSDAINLDGGGSSTMVVWNDVVNSPSDGSERTVANSMMVVSSLPVGELNSIQVMPQDFRLFRNEAMKFDVTGWDSNYNKKSINTSELEFSLSHDFGTIDSTGRFKAGLDPDTGFVYIDYNGMKDTARLIVKSVDRIMISPVTALIDTFSTVEFDIDSYDYDNISHDVALNEFTWSLLDDSYGTITEEGVFKAVKEGTVEVIAAFGEAKDTAEVTIELNEGEMLLDPMESLDNWTLESDQLNMDSSSISIDNSNFSQGSGSLILNYNFTYDNSGTITAFLKTDIPVEGVPGAITADVLSDGKDHHISYLISDANDEEFLVTTNQYSNVSTHFDTVRAAMTRVSALQPQYYLNYPIRIKEIQIKLASTKQNGTTYSGFINIDNLRIEYPSPVTSVDDDEFIPSEFYLKQNYPNPFNPSTTIEFNIAEESYITLKIFDALGREVETLISGELESGLHSVKWNAGNYSSGVYFYQINKDGKFITKKMMLVK